MHVKYNNSFDNPNQDLTACYHIICIVIIIQPNYWTKTVEFNVINNHLSFDK